jgi:valyl-tRNA synthetase
MFNKQYAISNIQLKQDEDCLDTWFSSWLWPFEVFKGYSNPGNADINYYYPTNTLVTAPEIIFFWVARMIMAGFEYKDEKPFSDVYFTGIVRDKIGRKMSKQLGNSPDLLEMIDKDGADAVRFGIMIASPAGNDLMWDQSGNEQGRFFINKMWNALKLVRSWESRVVSQDPEAGSFPVDWFESRLNEVKAEIEELYKDFKLSEILKTIYSLIWDDFCSWYLEWVKPPMNESIGKTVYNKTVEFFEHLMQLLHPFMPFITEEIYHLLKKRNETDDITIMQYPETHAKSEFILKLGEMLKMDITAIRDARTKNKIKNIERINFMGNGPAHLLYNRNQNALLLLQKQCNIVYSVPESIVKNSINEILVNSQDRVFYLTAERDIDSSLQKEQLIKDLEYQKGFLASVEKKLTNQRFVQNARPEVIEIERKKKADAEAKIKAIEESLSSL